MLFFPLVRGNQHLRVLAQLIAYYVWPCIAYYVFLIQPFFLKYPDAQFLHAGKRSLHCRGIFPFNL